MTGTDLCVNRPITVPVIFEPPCTITREKIYCLVLTKSVNQIWEEKNKITVKNLSVLTIALIPSGYRNRL